MTIINNINISGPINIVRLEGEVNSMKKVLYIFFDYHVRETKCSDYGSLDITQLFNKFTDEAVNLKNEWDLFIEDNIDYIYNKDVIGKSNYVNIYILELRNFFNNKFSEKVNNVIKKKDNIRYHYFDLRMTLNYFNIYDNLNNLIKSENINNFYNNNVEYIYKLILLDYEYILLQHLI